MKAVTLPSPPIALGRRKRLLVVPALGLPISWSLVASMPSKAEEAKSRPPLIGWAMAPTTPFPTPLKKPVQCSLHESRARLRYGKQVYHIPSIICYVGSSKIVCIAQLMQTVINSNHRNTHATLEPQ